MGRYQYDNNLKLSNYNFGLKLSENNNYNPEKSKTIPFPDDYTLAQLADEVYHSDHKLPDGWELLTTAKNDEFKNGYVGALFWNPEFRHIVLAHCGTTLSKCGSIYTDVNLALGYFGPGQAQSAATFAHRIQTELKQRFKSEYFQFSITGHSLGGWLSQITTFSVKYWKLNDNEFVRDENYLDNIHPHTVVFDSPGCFLEISKFVDRYEQGRYGDYNSLDILTYMAQPNCVNSCNEHIGLIYGVNARGHPLRYFLNLFEEKTKKIHGEIIVNFSTGQTMAIKNLLSDCITVTDDKYRTKIFDPYEHSLNVFNEHELCVVRNWAHLQRINFQPNIKITFRVDENNHVIRTRKPEDLEKIIAAIKYLRCTANVISEAVDKAVDNHLQDYENMFNVLSESCRDRIMIFNNFIFKDKYDLKSFVNSGSKIQNITLNEKCDWETEVSIVCNVLTSLEVGHTFLTWDKFLHALNILLHLNVNLLVIQCNEVDKIIQLMQRIPKSTKVILITPQTFPNQAGLELVRSECVGDKIKLQDITNQSRLELFNRNNLVFHNKEICLKDIIDYPQNNQECDNLSAIFSSKVLIEFLITNDGNKIEISRSFKNIFNTGMLQQVSKQIDFSHFETHIQIFKGTCLYVFSGNQYSLSQEEQKKIATWNGQGIIQKNVNDNMIETICYKNYNKIIYFLTVKDGKLYFDQIYNNKFYVNREIICEEFEVTPPAVQNKKTLKNKEIVIFCGFKNDMAHGSKSKDDILFIDSIEKAEEMFRELEYENAVYLIKAKNSTAKIDQKQLDTKEFIDKIGKIVIISEQAGMGKTTTLTNIYINLQITHWTFFIKLLTFAKELYSLPINLDTIIQFLSKSNNIPDNAFTHNLIKYSLKNTTKKPIFLLFDGFDELCRPQNSQISEKFVSLINLLLCETNAKIIITTRRGDNMFLQKRLKIYAAKFSKINNQDKIDFFANFWYYQLTLLQKKDNIDQLDDLRKKAAGLIESMENVCGNDISDFIGVPLQMRIIAEVMIPDEEKFVKTNFTNALELFTRYVDNRCNIYCRRNFLEEHGLAKIKEWSVKVIHDKCSALALKNLIKFPKLEVDTGDEHELTRVGIIQYSQFVHNTIADYYIYYTLVNNLVKPLELRPNYLQLEKLLVDDIFLKPNFKVVRLLINCYLQKNTNSNNRLLQKGSESKFFDGNRKQVMDLLKQKEYFFETKGNQSSLTIAVEENLEKIVQVFYLEIFNEKNCFYKRNKKLDTILQLSIKSPNVLNLFLDTISKKNESEIKEILLSTIFYSDYEKFNDLLSDPSSHPCIQELTNYVQRHSKSAVFNDILNDIIKTLDKLKLICQHISNSELELAQTLLKDFDNDTETKKSSQMYLMHFVVRNNNLDALKILLTMSYNKEVKDSHGMTPLARAAKQGYNLIVKELLNSGARYEVDANRLTPLTHAAKQGHITIVQTMIEHKKTLINFKDRYHMNALMWASKEGKLDVVKYLVEQGTQINETDITGITAVHYAVKSNHYEVVKFLIEEGANITIPKANNMTPLIRSIILRHWEIAELLINSGADINEKTKRGAAVIQLVIKANKPQLVKLLREKEVDISSLSARECKMYEAMVASEPYWE